MHAQNRPSDEAFSRISVLACLSAMLGLDPGPAELLPGRAVSDKDGIKRAELQRLGWASRRS